MNTRPDERLPFRELARQGARLARTLTADAMPRVARLAPGRGELQAQLAFSLDSAGRPWVQGEVSGVVRATCQRCLEQFDHALQTGFELCIVSDAALASELAERVDVLAAADADSVSIAEVVEDELILALPEQLCTREPCPYAPALSYPAAQAAGEEADDKPFQVLEVLKK